MNKNNFIRYYRVFKNETMVTEISTNDFKPVPAIRFKRGLPSVLPANEHNGAMYFRYSLPADAEMYYGYISKIKAMEMAKAGALTHINSMIDNVQRGIKMLKDYRTSHYNDLNTSLLESTIRKLEREMHIK